MLHKNKINYVSTNSREKVMRARRKHKEKRNSESDSLEMIITENQSGNEKIGLLATDLGIKNHC